MIPLFFLHIFHQREAEWCGVCLKFFCRPLIAFAAQDNIIISSCRPPRAQLVNNKASWTEACEATANPGIIPPLLLLFAHYFSSPLAGDNRLNYFHTIVFPPATKGQISSENEQHKKKALIPFCPLLSVTLDPVGALQAPHTVTPSVCCRSAPNPNRE